MERPKDPNPSAAVELSEAEFLQQQARLARKAMSRTLALVGRNVGQTVDPRAWTREHPWIMLTGAAAGGFAAAALTGRVKVPPPPQPARTDDDTVVACDEDVESPKRRPPKPRGWLQWLAIELFRAVRPAIVSGIVAGIHAKASNSQQGEASDANERDAE